MGKKKNKKTKKADRRIRYSAMGHELNPEVAMVQAALLLDEAAHDAVQSKNTDAMATVARGWMELGAVIHNMSVDASDEPEDGEEEDLSSETRIMGFGSPEAREVAENGYKN